MRTTVDLDPGVLSRAKHLAAREGRTLGAVVSDAIAAYLGSRRQIAKDPPFELIVRGKASGRFPAPSEILAIEDEEEGSRLGMSRRGRRGSP